MPLSVGITLFRWLVFGLIIRLELYAGFELLKPLLVNDRVGWSYLLLALAIAVLDVVVYLRLPDELLDSRKLAKHLLKLSG